MSKELSMAEVERRIYLVRGHRIMLDSDLAELYEINGGQLKRQVRRNLNRFPADFMFVLTREETRALRCQNGTLNRGQHSKYLPFGFTEHGVAMLSSVLNSRRAIQVNIAIIRVFMKIREIRIHQRQLAQHLEMIEKKLASHDELHGQHLADIRVIFQTIRQLTKSTNRKRRIGFKPEA